MHSQGIPTLKSRDQVSGTPLRVAVLGANGQVGSELCLFLSQQPRLEVIPVCRSIYGSALLRRCGLNPRHGEVKSEASARALIGDCDVVLDFSLPKGSTAQVRASIKQIISSVMAGGNRMHTFVYMSTMSVHRLSPDDAWFRTYASVKRYAERMAHKHGQQHGKSVTILRLAQVHGELQSVSRNLLREFRREKVTVPAGEANTVFVYTIAEAILSLLDGRSQTGTYTLVSTPAWNWSEIHTYYAARRGFEPEIEVAPLKPGNGTSLIRSIVQSARAIAYRNRDLIDNFLGLFAPRWQFRLRAMHARRRAGAEVGAMDAARCWAPYPREFPAPGRRMVGLSDSRMTMHSGAAAIRRLLDQAIV